MSPRQLLVPLLILIPLSAALLGGQQMLPVQPQIYCGRALSRMIANICYDVPMENSKRSEIGTMYGNLIPPYYYKEQETSLDWPWVSHKSTALGSLRGKRFIGNGIADECCNKPCSINEMLSYCF